jgi:Mrp family chromosome partitioning ATPase
MEHIEKALARAREMRSGHRGSGSTANESARRVNSQASVHGVMPDYTETAVSPTNARKTSEERLVADDLRNPVADVYRVLRAQVLQRMKKLDISTIAVTGASHGDGATTTAANLAMSIALDVNQTVLLVDLNLREPAIHRKFGLTPTMGIENYLHGECDIKDCLVNPGMRRLVVLPACAPKGESAELISSPRMAHLVRELRNRYHDRIIIFDTPPLLDSGETLGFLPNVEGVLFVARSGHTTKTELDRAADHLRNYQVIGTLLNGSR